MVTENKMTREHLREHERHQRIDRALDAGDHEFIEWIRTEWSCTQAEDDDEWSPEEIAEEARIAAERIAKGNFISLEEAERRMDEEFPEDAAFFRRLDAEFPGWEQHTYDIPPDSPEGIAFLRRLKAEFPDALHLFPPYRNY